MRPRRTAEQMAKLTTARVCRFRDAAYVLMELRAMRSNLDRIQERTRLTAEGKLQAMRSEVDMRMRSVSSHMESVLQQHDEDPGHTSEDAAELWREMGELFYRVEK